ncbi:uncharacterized protein K460DRAFT_404465 [Cucurbitaria berberidis CBS 394.84]|uniref:Uncharacterized protein n=1 Tax=Cucurbitaria berberidis CBS 394.84 TaxID=1168544 RepID=A0A9P4LBN3_9PLEO|nr:uncharacterized protein K460DRAFT_404465 [Cucurbitaria berberidis CBS 394.84]KAF1849230.1 hypothetical protein K460DRAFT_404465 [Cucurbitaria berberidis CBS 394.84]
MDPTAAKSTDTAPPAATIKPPQASTAQPPSPPPSQSGPQTESKVSTSNDAPPDTTPPFSPTSQTPILQKGQEEFEGTVDVNNDLPTEKDLERVGDMLVLDAQGQSRPFKELYQAPSVAPRQLIIFIRHFFCGNCQEYLRTLSSSIKPEDLLALPTPTFITVIGCGRPELIPMYTEATSCPFPIYAEPTRKLYDYLGMTRTFNLGAKPDYMHTNMLINSVQSIFQGLGTGKHALKGGDFKQVGGEFLFENGECTWAHRMKTTRGHAEVTDIRSLLGLDGASPPLRKRWSHSVKSQDKDKRRSMSWGRLRSKSRSAKDKNASGVTTPERVQEEDTDTKKIVGSPTI